jgi:hypothetical protein
VVFSNIYRTSLLALLLEQTKIVLVRKFLDVDVLKAILAMRRDDGIAESQPTAENFRFFKLVLFVDFYFIFWLRLVINIAKDWI